MVVTKLIDKGFVTRQRSESDAHRLDLTLTAKGHRTVRNLPPPIQHRIIEGVQRLPRAGARALAESLRDICDVLGIADENPPMLMDDEPKRGPGPGAKPAASKSGARRRSAR